MVSHSYRPIRCSRALFDFYGQSFVRLQDSTYTEQINEVKGPSAFIRQMLHNELLPFSHDLSAFSLHLDHCNLTPRHIFTSFFSNINCYKIGTVAYYNIQFFIINGYWSHVNNFTYYEFEKIRCNN